MDQTRYILCMLESGKNNNSSDLGKHIHCLKTLTVKELVQVQAYFSYRSFTENQVIYKSDSPAAILYFLQKGTVSLNQPNIGGNLDRFGVVPAHYAFGVETLWANERHAHEAIESCSIIVLPVRNWELIRLKYPGISEKIVKQIALELWSVLYEQHKNFKHLTEKLIQSNIIV